MNISEIFYLNHILAVQQLKASSHKAHIAVLKCSHMQSILSSCLGHTGHESAGPESWAWVPLHFLTAQLAAQSHLGYIVLWELSVCLFVSPRFSQHN
jgi:hypothetical protein